jgi:hypothetical protein
MIFRSIFSSSSLQRLNLLLCSVEKLRLEIPAAIENALDEHRIRRDDERDSNAALESGHPQSWQQVIALCSPQWKCREPVTEINDAADIAVRALLTRMRQEISGKPEGLPYLALEGLSRNVAERIISQTALEQGWRLETSVPEIARQLALESQKLDCPGEVFPVYLQIFLKQAHTNLEGRITAEFIPN